MSITDYISSKPGSDHAYHAAKVRNSYTNIDQFIKQNSTPENDLNSKLEDILMEKYKQHKVKVRGAEILDWTNRWLVAPADLVGRALGPVTGGVGYAVSNIAKIASWIPKALYSAYYTLTTGDVGLATAAAAQEATSYFVPFGGTAYLANVYSPSAKGYLRREAAKEFENRYMTGRNAPNVTDITDLLDKRKKDQGGQPDRKAA